MLSVESIYYYPGLDLAFHEVHRVLKPGGKAFFLTSYYKENTYGHEWAKYIDIPVHLLGAEGLHGRVEEIRIPDRDPRTDRGLQPASRRLDTDTLVPYRQDHLKFRAEGALLLIAEK